MKLGAEQIRFEELLSLAALPAVPLAGIARKALDHLKGKGEPPARLAEMQRSWYASLEAGRPDYSVYDRPEYLAEAWLCQEVYAKKYLKLIRPIVLQLNPAGGAVLDLGNGMGVSTAILKGMFPGSQVTGTNFPGSLQWKVATRLAAMFGFRMSPGLDSAGKASLVFASEYFEHFEAPLQHLEEVLEKTSPRVLVVANTFGPRAIGHFDRYKLPDGWVEARVVGREFNKLLRLRGFKKLETGFWNSRPSIWVAQ